MSLEFKLKENYPKLFSRLEHFKAKEEWGPLLFKFCEKLQTYIEENEEQQVTISAIYILPDGQPIIHANTHGMEKAEELIDEIEEDILLLGID